MLPGVVTANDGRRGSRSANHKCVGASAESWLSGREGNEIQTKKEMVNLFFLCRRNNFMSNLNHYRTWQMGLFICSTNLVSIRTVRAQVEGELTAVVGDCQNVLFKVTVPPQVVIVSVHQGEQDISYLNSQIIKERGIMIGLTDAADFSKDARTARPTAE